VASGVCPQLGGLPSAEPRFDEFIGYHSGNIDFVSHVGDHGEHDWWHGRVETREEGYATDLINRHAVEFIERHHARPFFLYVAHLAIHNPLQARGDPVRRAEDGTFNDWKPASEEERIEKYRQMTLPIDEGVGRIHDTLARLGIDRRTLVIFCTDNGASAELPSGDPRWRAGKGAVYEGGHKVPCIAWWPGHIPAGTASDVPAMTMDLLPTCLTIAGIEPPAGHVLDGADLSPVLLHQESLPPRPLYWASLANNGSRSEALRDGTWKLVVRHPRAKPGTFENELVELYHLGDDPGESHDLATNEQTRAAEMLARLKEWYAETTASAPRQPGGW
jgi:arylsulfatase A